jgi:hypothetical protein
MNRQMHDKKPIDRATALAFLLRPVVKRDNQRVIDMRIIEVNAAHAFLIGKEQQQADQWIEQAEALRASLKESNHAL